MLSKKFNWQPNLPKFDEKNPQNFINEINKLLKESNGLKKLLEKDLEYYKRKKFIKRYTRVKIKNDYYLRDKKSDIGLYDLHSEDFIKLDYIKYDIAIKKDSPIKPLDIDFNKVDRKNDLIKSLERNNELIVIKEPWKINLHKIKVKNLKTQDNVRLTFTLGIDVEDIRMQLPHEDNCDHKFRLFRTGLMVWKWRLIWQCVNCGFLCYCKCFEEAIKYADNRESDYWRREKIKKEKGIDISNLPYYPNACEVCRDKPSTHKYCHDMYARSEFEKRYGAYVKKKYYELKANNRKTPNDFDLEKYANNLMREKLGFKKIGEQYVTETELYRIVNSIFKGIKIIHHYRGDWLKGQELDIYVL